MPMHSTPRPWRDSRPRTRGAPSAGESEPASCVYVQWGADGAGLYVGSLMRVGLLVIRACRTRASWLARVPMGNTSSFANQKEGALMRKRLAAIAAVGVITVAGVGASAASAVPPQASNACDGLGKAVFHTSVSQGNHEPLLGVFAEHCS